MPSYVAKNVKPVHKFVNQEYRAEPVELDDKISRVKISSSERVMDMLSYSFRDRIKRFLGISSKAEKYKVQQDRVSENAGQQPQPATPAPSAPGATSENAGQQPQPATPAPSAPSAPGATSKNSLLNVMAKPSRLAMCFAAILVGILTIQIALSWKALKNFEVAKRSTHVCGPESYLKEVPEYQMYQQSKKRSMGLTQTITTLIAIYLIFLGILSRGYTFDVPNCISKYKWVVIIFAALCSVISLLPLYAPKKPMIAAQIVAVLVLTLIAGLVPVFMKDDKDQTEKRNQLFICAGIVFVFGVLLITNLVVRNKSIGAVDGYDKLVREIDSAVRDMKNPIKNEFAVDIAAVDFMPMDSASSFRPKYLTPYLKTDTLQLRNQLESRLGIRITDDIYRWKTDHFGVWLDSSNMSVDTIKAGLEKADIKYQDLKMFPAVEKMVAPLLESTNQDGTSLGALKLREGQPSDTLYAFAAEGIYKELDRLRMEETPFYEVHDTYMKFNNGKFNKILLGIDNYNTTILYDQYTKLEKVLTKMQAIQRIGKEKKHIIRSEKALMFMAVFFMLVLIGGGYYLLYTKMPENMALVFIGLTVIVAAIFMYVWFSSVLVK